MQAGFYVFWGNFYLQPDWNFRWLTPILVGVKGEVVTFFIFLKKNFKFFSVFLKKDSI